MHQTDGDQISCMIGSFQVLNRYAKKPGQPTSSPVSPQTPCSNRDENRHELSVFNRLNPLCPPGWGLEGIGIVARFPDNLPLTELENIGAIVDPPMIVGTSL
jgi:hypothetical protein